MSAAFGFRDLLLAMKEGKFMSNCPSSTKPSCHRLRRAHRAEDSSGVLNAHEVLQRGMATSIPPVRRVCSCTQPRRNYLAQKKGWGAMLLLHLCPTLNLQHSGVLEEEKNTRFYKLGMDFLLGIGA